ncbi:MAG TPA: hypothetical protein VKZ53_18855 [Candidatus Angelobacter sp.]|nr:hypothetical protein [Candidatus Angelobacter sp.]
MGINREVFDEQRHPRFGNDNPERMTLAFWEWMIRGDENRSSEEGVGLEALGLRMRDGKLKSSYGPYRVRDLFKIPLNREDGPIWTFDRMGATRSQLSDGRVICIGGEHEDYYDPDFNIYNDVIVVGPVDQIEVYGYPKEIFPPTDFHTATVASDQIIVIGGLGYPRDRHPGQTPVYSLDLCRYSISQIATLGENPGWISKHQASYDPKGVITIVGGEVIRKERGRQRFHRNFEDYALDMTSWVWQRLTNRNWRQFSVSQENGLFVLERHPKPDALLPRNIEHTVVQCKGKEDARFIVAEVPVSLTVGVTSIDIVIEGAMPEPLAARLAAEIRANTEATIQRACILEQVQ